MKLPLLTVHFDCYELDGQGNWRGKDQLAEVLTIHFEKKTARVRGKQMWDGIEKPYTIDVSLTERQIKDAVLQLITWKHI